jgi:hypothetical protein
LQVIAGVLLGGDSLQALLREHTGDGQGVEKDETKVDLKI